MTVTFFGHRDAPSSIYELIKKTIKDFIENNNAGNFYVGNHGNFDSMVLRALRELQIIYPNIIYAVVIAYMPKEDNCSVLNPIITLLPDGIEKTPPRYAITKRNNWMIEKSDIVLTYVKHSFGGAATFAALATKKGKNVINIFDKTL